ncbi:MAG TPA: M56 family metallopeptidase [Gemmatimonadaceae bacterium]|nr:M56 family metallopeptidase [Gemmatimonadaceae bacterium]
MSAGVVLYVTLVLALAAAMGWAIEAVLRQLGRPSRWAWLAASAVALVLTARATLATRADPVDASYPRMALPAAGTVVSPEWSPLQVMREAVAISVAAVGSAADAVVRVIPGRVTSIAVALWLAASILALVMLVLVHLRLRRSRRHWAETELFGTRVRIAPDMGPAVVGVVRPQIVVPRWLLGRSSREQQLVLAHEREHLGARDHLLLGAGSLVVALVPWHPAAWWMLSRLRLAIELDCDARVLRKGVPARTYGTLLIDLADRCTGFRVGATALADEGSHLERRLLAMKTTKTKRSYLRAGMLGSAAALMLLVACEAKVPTGPEIEAMDVASATKAATDARLLRKTELDAATKPVYYVDGKLVDERTANALTPNQIATIDINKGGAQPVIRIATNGQAPIARGQAYKGTTRVTVRDSNVVALGGGPEKARIAGLRDGMGSPLILIDGVKADNARLQALNPDRIASINVIKGAKALTMSSDPAATNGIIEVTTKK